MQQDETIIVKVQLDEKQRNRYVIFFEHAAPINVHEDTMVKYRLTKGSEVSISFLEEIIRADEQHKGYIQALTYLQRKPRTRMEMAKYLQQKEYDDETIPIVLDRLEREWLVDDAAYAEQWAEQRITRHSKGSRWIRQELKQKGVHENHIRTAIESIDPEQEWESAVGAAAKKWRQTRGETYIRKNKVAAYLARRGFSSEMSRKAAQQVADESVRNDQGEETW
ncbi:regulatory protein RecX [Paenibacillus assamensis]|uniref:regulatory protein RecX n=1 Tax=Paenibacillus assamensis TaxID=311244 RepID=UPI000402A121|nr:RecX family transcriptional regulator [Paenibacillus assamensis]